MPGGPGPAHEAGRAGGHEGRQVAGDARGLRRAGDHLLEDPAGVVGLHHGRRGGRRGPDRGWRGRRADPPEDCQTRQQNPEASQGLGRPRALVVRGGGPDQQGRRRRR